MSAAQKESRGQASLVSKMTFLEVWRRFCLIVSIDILIVLLFLGALIVRCEIVASEYDFSDASENTGKKSYSLILADYEPRGIKLGFNIDKVPFLKQGVIRDLYIFQLSGFHISMFRSPVELLVYSIAIPANTASTPQYWHFRFNLGEPAYYFQQCFSVLLLLEALGLFTCGLKIQKSIRKSLRPIYDLTLLAQNVNAGVNPVVAIRGNQELHLSGAIDTLNNITEDDLGHRIVISDEREELRGLASAINAMLDRLDAAYRSQLRFVSDASHELRTPIAVIQGYANMLDRWGKNDTDTLQESIDAIKSEAGGMQDLVEQLLFLARSDNRSIVLSVGTVDTFALADEVLRETQMIDPNHEFAERLTESLYVRGDLQLLKQALRIFMDNAIKYTPNGGRITLSTVSEDDYAKISVSDTGIGIPAQDLDRVFDRFFRSDESRTRGTGGTGLGLSIAKWIIDRHGGFVEIISREDFGTKVTISLPKVIDAPVAVPPTGNNAE